MKSPWFLKCFLVPDEDECAVRNPCSHTCHNAVGSYYCSCPKGLTISADGRTCQGKISVAADRLDTKSPLGKCSVWSGPFCNYNSIIYWWYSNYFISKSICNQVFHSWLCSRLYLMCFVLTWWGLQLVFNYRYWWVRIRWTYLPGWPRLWKHHRLIPLRG